MKTSPNKGASEIKLGKLAGNASPLYARNLQNFLDPLIKDGALKIDWADEIIAGTLVARDGELVHKMFKS